MLIRILLAASIICFSTFARAQNQLVTTIGGIDEECGHSIIQTTDGGYAITGFTTTYGAGSEDALLTKFNSMGIHQWTRVLGDFFRDEAWALVQTSDGGYVLAGHLYINGFINEALLSKFDASGTHVWTRTLGFTANTDDRAFSLIQTSDGGFAIAGYTEDISTTDHAALLSKLDASGAHEWTRVLSVPTGLFVFDEAWDVIQTSDGGYVIAGMAFTLSTYSFDMLLAKFDSTGSYQWTTLLEGMGDDITTAVVQTQDGGYAVAGYTNSFGAGGFDAILSKLDASGAHEWSRTLGGPENDMATSLILAQDGGLVLARETTSHGAGSWDVLFSKFNALGTHQWTRTLGGASDEYAYDLIQTSDGGYALTGGTGSYGAGDVDILFMKYDAAGFTCMGETFVPTVLSVSPLEENPTVEIFYDTPVVKEISPTITSPDPSAATWCGGAVSAFEDSERRIDSPFDFHVENLNGGLWISYALADVGEDLTIRLMDPAGRVHHSRLINNPGTSGRIRIDVELASGVYFVEGTHAGVRVVRKWGKFQ
jgi:hypothetical protein